MKQYGIPWVLCLFSLWAPLATGQALGEAWNTWDALLARHVDSGIVDYSGLGREQDFESLLTAIANGDTTDMSRAEQLAFYINAYNILAIKGILNGRSPTRTLGRARFFKFDQYLIAGDRLSLHKLEHQRLRRLAEPRIHFAIVCASASCPPLRSEAYRAASLDAQLDDNTRIFVNDNRKNRFDPERREAALSKIFDWFREDFDHQGAGLQPFLARYITDRRSASLLEQRAFALSYLPYDWSLNGRLD